jgi:hypothetical protein
MLPIRENDWQRGVSRIHSRGGTLGYVVRAAPSCWQRNRAIDKLLGDVSMDFAKLIERAKNICLSPQTEWPKIAEEQTSVGSIFTGYVMILAAIGAIATILGSLVGGRLGLTFGIAAAVVGYVIGLIAVFVVSLIVNALAPTFDGTKNPVNAMKVVAYSMTPGWLAGVFNIIPLVGGIIVLIASLYGIYLMYLGLSPNMKNPQDKSIGYTALVIVCYILLFAILSFVLMGLIVGGLFGGAAMLGGMR